MLNRREFIGLLGAGALTKPGRARTTAMFSGYGPVSTSGPGAKESKAYGSGHFGEWITDQFGLPAYRYTCDQTSDPTARTPVHKEWRSATDHTHQVGNDRLVAAVSNYGYLQVRQDEGSPKFLNDYSPERGYYGAGIGFLTVAGARPATAPWESRTLYIMYGYLPEGFTLAGLRAKYRANPAALWSGSSAKWKADGVRLNVPAAPWVARETAWHNYYLRSSLTYDSFFREHVLSQGHIYQYVMGFQGAARDPLQHAMPFVFSRPEIVREVLRYTLKEIQPDGSIPYGIVGSGVPMPVQYRPSDQEMWLLWLASEYVLATRDRNFLDEKIPAYPRRDVVSGDPTIRDPSAGEMLRRCYRHLVDVIGAGQHGLMRLSNGDWNDGVVVGNISSELHAEIREHGESVLNAAMACYVLDHYGRLLNFEGESKLAAEAQAKAEAQRQAVRAQWAGSWFRRAWLGAQLGWTGEKQVWLEPQPWAIIGGAATPEQSAKLVDTLDRLVRKPSPIGAMLHSERMAQMGMAPGMLTNGGIWPSINGTLIWALALTDGAMAWDEWKKNSLALHAEAYPDIWYGIWSGPDSYNSTLSRHPGQTMFVESASGGPPQWDWGVNWTDFPVMNLHPHAWPLYSAVKLLGVEFNESGLSLKPSLPLDEYEFTSPLLGFKKSARGYSGWYAPIGAGRWEIRLSLPEVERERFKRIDVNGATRALPRSKEAVIRFIGDSGPGKPLRWAVS
jgi:hypothetical protein